MPDSIEVDRQTGEMKATARRFDDRDFKYLADFVVDEYNRRKNTDERKDREKQWADIDRQIAMLPELQYKKLPNGQIDPKRAWMAEMELPLQAQALEVLTADARRMMFPDSGPWFRAHAEVTDEYLRKVDFKSMILGDEMQVPSEINQDNADKLVEGFLTNCVLQYDHRSRFDQINAETFKYGMGIGRARKELKKIYIHETKGTRSITEKLPVIVPASIKNTFPDDAKPSMHSAQVLAPTHIAHEWMRYENLVVAAQKGSNNPDDEDGGWMPKQLGKVQPDKNGFVQVLEIEGDIIVPRKTIRSVIIPNAILTVVLGSSERPDSPATRAVVRLRYNQNAFSSYLFFPYHWEGATDIYPTSPLMKGRPVQMMATDALNRALDAAMLKNAPPVSYDPNDPYFAQNGGPMIYPTAMWGSADAGSIKAHTEIGGDPSALTSMMMQAINLYAQLTGVLPARVGAQTVSHTTAYAKGAELQQGATRTVDYVNQSGHGPITRWLDMAYQIGRDALPDNKDVTFYIEAYGGFVKIDKSMLPEKAGFEWFGSGGPAEAQQKIANKVNALNMAVKIDQIRMETGKPPRVNLDNAVDEVLREGGWTDLAAITSGGSPALPAPGNPGTAVAALQTIGIPQQ